MIEKLKKIVAIKSKYKYKEKTNFLKCPYLSLVFCKKKKLFESEF